MIINGVSKALSWQGRRLTDITGSTYQYNSEGIRTKKITPNETTTFELEGSNIISMSKVTSTENVRLDFVYDASATLIGVNTIEGHYFYIRDITCNILGLIDNEGNYIVKYKYDAWGKVLEKKIYESCIASRHNPFVYKGYFLDEETSLYMCNSRYYDPEIGRFISPDDISYLDPESIGGLNLYAYCGCNPVMRLDPTGHFWDTIFDIGFLIWSIVDVVRNPGDWKNWAALGVDLLFAVIPFIPSGAGQVIKVGNRIDDFADVASAINKIDNIHDIGKVTMIGRNMGRVENVAGAIGKADNLYDTWKGYDRSATGLKKLFHNVGSMFHNGGWLFGKLRKGYTVIDIGVTTAHKGIKAFGLWYGTERFVVAMWKTRNLWKFPINYF